MGRSLAAISPCLMGRTSSCLPQIISVGLVMVAPDGSASRRRDRIRERAGIEGGVGVADSFGRAWRRKGNFEGLSLALYQSDFHLEVTPSRGPRDNAVPWVHPNWQHTDR